MNMLQQAAQWIEQQRQTHLAIPIIYNGYSINATIGKTLFRAENEYGVTIRVESKDFLISVNDLENPPEKGDTIIYDNHRYEVLAPNGERHWRWCGSEHLTYRIHTKMIGEI